MSDSTDSPAADPLYVDLDGTLIRSDVLVESLFALLKSSPFVVFLFPIWLWRGKANFKRQIALRVDLDLPPLPWSPDFLEFLRAQRDEGRRLVLITASDQKYADAVSEHLGLFDQVFGSDGVTNLSGGRKLDRITADAGEEGFDYAGNSGKDLEIWPRAKDALLVNPLPYVVHRARQQSNVVRVFSPISDWFSLTLEACRVHQWLKNLLVFVPLVFSHRIMESTLLLQGALAFVSFGLCASSLYLLNDLLDLHDDRQHPSKRYRPVASGAVPLDFLAGLVPLLLLGSITIALFLPSGFLLVLALYFTITIAYSLRLKQFVILDVIVLAALYTIRLLAGGAATGVTVSYWLLVFSMFFFLGLGMLKRYTEINDPGTTGGVAGRGYRAEDAALLKQFGVASGYIAVFVLALYINSEQVRIQYDRPQAIWLLCPVLLYWISRAWLLANRGEMHEDPVLFAIRDRTSHILIVLTLAVLWVAS